MSLNDTTQRVGSVLYGMRKPLTVGSDELVDIQPYAQESRAVVCTPVVSGLNPQAWISRSKDTLQRLINERGAVLLRGFEPLSAEGLGDFAASVGGELLDYDNRSTPRRKVSNRVFTSTEYPADQSIPLHNEMSFTDTWPRLLFINCMTPPTTGGETPIADSARVYQRIPLKVRERFEQHGVMYIRNYGHGLDLSWEEVFQTARRDDVNAYCKRHGISVEWMGERRLRTRQIVQASIRSAGTGKMVWFNQAHLFHVSALPDAVARELRDSYDEDDLPRNALHGDGSSIEDEELDAIRQSYSEEAIERPWQRGDVIVLDNVQFAHGRRPFHGSRSILVAMT